MYTDFYYNIIEDKDRQIILIVIKISKNKKLIIIYLINFNNKLLYDYSISLNYISIKNIKV